MIRIILTSESLGSVVLSIWIFSGQMLSAQFWNEAHSLTNILHLLQEVKRRNWGLFSRSGVFQLQTVFYIHTRWQWVIFYHSWCRSLTSQLMFVHKQKEKTRCCDVTISVWMQMNLYRNRFTWEHAAGSEVISMVSECCCEAGIPPDLRLMKPFLVLCRF